MNLKSTIAVLSVCISIVSSSASAALIERLGGLAYYDEDADLTWLADANAAAGSAFDDGLDNTDGRMTWASANAWVAGLDVNGVTGWRLPTTPGCVSCTTELSNMFINVLGGSGSAFGDSIIVSHNANFDLFSNILSSVYWTSVENPGNTTQAYVYSADFFSHGFAAKLDSWYAWAVHTGDVSAVPVPSAVWLFGSGLVALLGFSRAEDRS